MKVVALFISLLLVARPAKNDLARQNLKGRVRTLTHYQFPVSHGRVDTAWSKVYVFKYDERGNQVEDIDYTGGSPLTGGGRMNHRRVYIYDATGNQSEVLEYNPDGTLNQRVLYEYDGTGNRLSRKNFTADGRLWRKSAFRYNTSGQLVGTDKYADDSVLLEQFTYKYDIKGNQVGELLYVAKIADTTRQHSQQFRDSIVGNNKVTRLDYVKGFTFDDSGKKVSEVNTVYGSSFPFTTTYKYGAYDDQGNWLREVFIENGKATCIIERVIDYY